MPWPPVGITLRGAASTPVKLALFQTVTSLPVVFVK